MILTIADHFSIIKDPRQQSKIEYELLDVIFLCVVGMICGAEAWDDMEMVGEARLNWFQNKGFLLNGVPTEERNNPVRCLNLGQQVVRVAYHLAGVGGWKKQMLICNG
ncbi:MAG: hypothetical protein LEGION0403_FIIPPAGN_02326 [Legionella sp.]|uniref:transposase family protein n=1 Tax=Legionella sp. TaxID=459 RepID=UPI003D102DA3